MTRISFDDWTVLSDKTQYGIYQKTCNKLRDAEEIISDAVEERENLKEKITELEEELKGYRDGEDSFQKDQRKTDSEGLL